jgi:peptide/nickel transport system ATP-binding protein
MKPRSRRRLRRKLSGEPMSAGFTMSDQARTDQTVLAAMQDDAVLKVENLRTWYTSSRGIFRRRETVVKALDDVSFELKRGETLSLVGESGCGKTTLGRTIIRMIKPTSGAIRYRRKDGSVIDLATLSNAELRDVHRDIRMIFQDPHSSLNPRLPVIDLVGEAMKVNGIAHGKDLEDRVVELLRKVGLRPEYVRRYPHAFSGGERQRLGIARALSMNPRIIVADEAVSALDVSIQAQTLNLLQDLKAEFDLTFLFIAHDLSVVRHISDRVAVMYVGRIVEIAETDALFNRPLHPYTEALLSSVPIPDPRRRGHKRIRLAGEVADPANPPPGCAFHPRCSYATDICRTAAPRLTATTDGRFVSCHHADALALAGVDGSSVPAAASA